MSNISNNAWGEKIRLTDSWERRGRLWLQTSGLLSYKAWTSHTRLCRQIYVEKNTQRGRIKKKWQTTNMYRNPEHLFKVPDILCLVAEKRYVHIAQDQIQVQTGNKTKGGGEKNTSMLIHVRNKTDGQRWTCGMKKHWPIPLWQIRFHVKEDIFFIFDLWFDVRYELQVFLITAFCTPVNNRQNEERLMLINFNSASTTCLFHTGWLWVIINSFLLTWMHNHFLE